MTVQTLLCSNPQTTRPLAYNAPPAEVQTELEKLCPVGGGNVSVSAGTAGQSSYVVSFVGELAGVPVKPMRVDGSALTGPHAGATVTQVLEGALEAKLVVTATNIGGAFTDGTAITLEDVLPTGLTANSIVGYDTYGSRFTFDGSGSSAMNCPEPTIPACTYSGAVGPGDSLVMTISVSVASALSTPLQLTNRATVNGGRAGAPVSSSAPLTMDSTPAAFGPDPNGTLAAISTDIAGAHPNVTTAFQMSTSESNLVPSDVRDIRFDLPPGLVGTTVGMPRCTMHNVLAGFTNSNACPGDSMVGIATIGLGTGTLGPRGGPISVVVPIYNIEPAPGEPVAFAFDALLLPVRLDTSVLSNGDYGVRVTAGGLSQSAVVLSTGVTIWGVPADHSGPGPNGETTAYGQPFGGPNPSQARAALLNNPQQCSTSLSATMEADSWIHPGAFVPSPVMDIGTLTGCEQLSIEPSFSMLPDTLEAGAPAGYSFALRVPQWTGPDQVATPNVKNVSLTLPVGTVVNPSAAWGLKACTDAQFGLHSGRSSECPREAQVGTVRIKTPALEEGLEGQVYLGTPECNPCSPQDAEGGRMVHLLVNVVGEGESGIVVKLEGRGHIDQQTGQVTTVFDENPQLPFDEFKLKLGGGPRAVLANPRACGPATSTMDLTPWSTPFTPDSMPSYGFAINQGCFGPQFKPSFVAGSPNIQAGEYTPFTLAFGRSDQDEFLSGISLKMPPGLLGNIGSVVQCKEPEASEGTCGEASLIGHTQVLTGPGADPFLVTGGKVFLTEGYEGAPYGLSIVVPAVAGPYTLSGTAGKGTVVVRARIQVDPITAALTVTSDPLPSMLDGIPLQLKVVNVTIDRPSFTFNPTNCGKLSIGASLSSTEGMSANVASPFQVTNCANLAFKPQFNVSTQGRTSRANGASLDVKLAYPKAAWGSQANIAKVKVDLPKQLPSRLTTLQKACPDSAFNQNPAACPVGSRVGSATATTPIIPVALSGPAYFVSHGGAKFPELVIVLSGYGVTVQLHGETFISKAGITSSTLRQLPDVPIGTFELKLPEGPNSALAANKNLCAGSLKMPTAFTAQNGMTIKQSTPISVTGCAKHKKKAKKASARHKVNKHKRK